MPRSSRPTGTSASGTMQSRRGRRASSSPTSRSKPHPSCPACSSSHGRVRTGGSALRPSGRTAGSTSSPSPERQAHGRTSRPSSPASSSAHGQSPTCRSSRASASRPLNRPPAPPSSQTESWSGAGRSRWPSQTALLGSRAMYAVCGRQLTTGWPALRAGLAAGRLPVVDHGTRGADLLHDQVTRALAHDTLLLSLFVAGEDDEVGVLAPDLPILAHLDQERRDTGIVPALAEDFQALVRRGRGCDRVDPLVHLTEEELVPHECADVVHGSSSSER